MRRVTLAAALLVVVGSAAAQDYPARPVTVVVPVAAGGPTDTISRVTAQAMSKVLGQQLTTVPYRGTAPVMNDLIGKQIDMACDQATNTTGPILGKQIKAYAVTTKTRLNTLADIPTADAAQSTLLSEIDRWAPIIKAAGQFAD